MSQFFSRWFRYSPLGLGLLAMACVAGWLAAWPLLEYRTLTRLRDHGGAATARIISNRTDASGRFAVDIVRYDFQPGDTGPVYTGEERFRSDERENGDPTELARGFYQGGLTARFAPEDPSVNRLDLWFPERIHHSGWHGSLLFAAAAGLGLWGLFLLTRGATSGRWEGDLKKKKSRAKKMKES